MSRISQPSKKEYSDKKIEEDDLLRRNSQKKELKASLENQLHAKIENKSNEKLERLRDQLVYAIDFSKAKQDMIEQKATRKVRILYRQIITNTSNFIE